MVSQGCGDMDVAQAPWAMGQDGWPRCAGLRALCHPPLPEVQTKACRLLRRRVHNMMGGKERQEFAFAETCRR